ncbi:MAG: tyrosine-type recombinase/integrase [Bryobacteraceae bacterium]
MRTRHSIGGVRKQRGRWIGSWTVDGKRGSQVVGLIKDMTKTEAREKVAKIVTEERAKGETCQAWKLGEFVEKVYFPYYSRKWKDSTRENNINRVNVHLVKTFKDRELRSFRRDELQDLLDLKASVPLSFSVVDHLRWDLKQIFDMAVAEGQVERNPALLLFTPKAAKKPVHRAMTIKEVQICFGALDLRERLIAKLAILAGMRPGEIFAMTWGRLTATHADIQQRIYRRRIDTPKTDNSTRQAALSEGLLVEIESWRMMAVESRDDAWVFPSERMTPLSKDNWWNRVMCPALKKVGLEWATFQVMRRTNATLMKALGADGKLVADQLGHTLDVSQNVYTQSSVESRSVIVNQLEQRLLIQ